MRAGYHQVPGDVLCFVPRVWSSEGCVSCSARDVLGLLLYWFTIILPLSFSLLVLLLYYCCCFCSLTVTWRPVESAVGSSSTTVPPSDINEKHNTSVRKELYSSTGRHRCCCLEQIMVGDL